MENYWKNAIMGVVIGDALGCPVQFEDREMVKYHPITEMRGNGTFDLPIGTWTDDSSLTLALLDSIRQTNQLDIKDVMNRFVDWLDNGAYTPFGKAFDIGTGTLKAIIAYKHRGRPHQCGSRDEWNNGNGSLMRIMPACLFCYEKGYDQKDAVGKIHEIGSLTHAHIRSNIACGLYYFMVKAIISGKGLTWKDRLQEGLSNGFLFYEQTLYDHENLNYYRRLRDLQKFEQTLEKDIRSSGYVVDTLEAAVWSLITTNSFETALLKAVNLGYDSDTVGAVTGGLAGLIYGCYNPWGASHKWIDLIQKKEWIEDLCDQVNERLDQRVEDTKPCVGFSMDDAEKAFEHMHDKERIRDYGDRYGKNILHTWDDGHRLLMRCKKCGGYILLQLSEFHGMEEDSYYADYFPVCGPGEARRINNEYNGDAIEEKFPNRWIIADAHPHWNI